VLHAFYVFVLVAVDKQLVGNNVCQKSSESRSRMKKTAQHRALLPVSPSIRQDVVLFNKKNTPYSDHKEMLLANLR